MSPNAMSRLGGKVVNIVRSHNYIGKHGWKAIGDAVHELAGSEYMVFSFLTWTDCDDHEPLYESRIGGYPLHLRPSQRKWSYIAVRFCEERHPTRWQPNHQTFTWVHQNLVDYGSFKATIYDTLFNS
ncbi:hypothetical protein TNCV_2260411 [Trichonephila clavipes]|nr:hypothetical protein TNCV_2260411 [Trichonephila clavipes]